MTAAISGMPFFLLQEWEFWREEDPREALIILAVTAIIITLFIVFKVFTRGVQFSNTGRSRTSSIAPRKFNAFTLHRIASAYGLDRSQTKLLEFVFRTNSVSDPFRVLKTPALLDRHFRRVFRTIEKNSATDEDAQESLQKLFSLRNIIEASSGVADSTEPVRLSDRYPAILVVGRENFPVKVLTTKGNTAIIEMPRNTLGTPIRISAGTDVSLAFFTKPGNGFSLDGKLIGTVHTDFGPGFQVNHTGKAKPLAKRKSRRKQVDLRCDFFLVNVIEQGRGRKMTLKLVVDNRRFKGSVLDISTGGCALKTSAAVPVGSRIKIVIEYEDNYNINVLGQAIRSNHSTSGSILHIKFLKVTRRAFNLINSMVYGYNDAI